MTVTEIKTGSDGSPVQIWEQDGRYIAVLPNHMTLEEKRNWSERRRLEGIKWVGATNADDVASAWLPYKIEEVVGDNYGVAFEEVDDVIESKEQS